MKVFKINKLDSTKINQTQNLRGFPKNEFLLTHTNFYDYHRLAESPASLDTERSGLTALWGAQNSRCLGSREEWDICNVWIIMFNRTSLFSPSSQTPDFQLPPSLSLVAWYLGPSSWNSNCVCSLSQKTSIQVSTHTHTPHNRKWVSDSWQCLYTCSRSSHQEMWAFRMPQTC